MDKLKINNLVGLCVECNSEPISDVLEIAELDLCDDCFDYED